MVHHRIHSLRATAVLLATAMTVVACGQGQGQLGRSVADPEASVSPSVSPTPGPGGSVQPSASGVPSLSSTYTGTKGPGELTLRGEMDDGVEAGCRVFRADDGNTYQLVSGDPAVLSAPGRIEVTGRLQPDLATSCQQGTPFVVSHARHL